jgi:hypothetical protein
MNISTLFKTVPKKKKTTFVTQRKEKTNRKGNSMLKTSSTSDILHTQGAPYLLHFHLFGLSSCEATGKYTTILYVLINSKKNLGN